MHVRVIMNGASCGNLCFRVDEFEQVRKGVHVEYVPETVEPEEWN